MVTVPDVRPVTKPDALLMVATVGLEDTHEPPDTELASVVVPLAQTVVVPVIEPGDELSTTNEVVAAQ